MARESLSGTYYSASFLSPAEGANRTISPGFQKVVNQSTDFILKRALLLETGSQELHVQQVSSELRTEINDVFSAVLTDVDPESDDGKRVRAAVRPIMESFLQGSLIRSIHYDSYLSLLYTSILLARDPSLFQELTISTGFGGSDDEDINIRVPSYIIPGLKILENLRDLQRKNIINFNLPKFRVFFAPHTAIAINSAKMSSEDVLRNMVRTHKYLSKYIEFFHHDIASQVYFEVENSWDQHDAVTESIIHYFSQLLISSQDETVIKSLRILQERGVKHGNEDGARLSHIYAALHPLLFKDSLNHPPVNVFADDGKSVFALSLGGRPERLFNILRSYIRKNAQRSSASELIQGEGDDLLQTRIGPGKPLNGNIFPVQPNYSSSPVTSVMAITDVGRTPVYYRTEYDSGIQSYDDFPLSSLKRKKEAIVRNLQGQEMSLELKRLEEIDRDIRVIIEDAGSELILMKFLSNLDN